MERVLLFAILVNVLRLTRPKSLQTALPLLRRVRVVRWRRRLRRRFGRSEVNNPEAAAAVAAAGGRKTAITWSGEG